MDTTKAAGTSPQIVGSIWRLPRVEQETGLRKSTLYKLMAEDKFVKSVKLSSRCVGFYEPEVKAWIEARIKASRGAS